MLLLLLLRWLLSLRTHAPGIHVASTPAGLRSPVFLRSTLAVLGRVLRRLLVTAPTAVAVYTTMALCISHAAAVVVVVVVGRCVLSHVCYRRATGAA